MRLLHWDDPQAEGRSLILFGFNIFTIDIQKSRLIFTDRVGSKWDFDHTPRWYIRLFNNHLNWRIK